MAQLWILLLSLFVALCTGKIYDPWAVVFLRHSAKLCDTLVGWRGGGGGRRDNLGNSVIITRHNQNLTHCVISFNSQMGLVSVWIVVKRRSREFIRVISWYAVLVWREGVGWSLSLCFNKYPLSSMIDFIVKVVRLSSGEREMKCQKNSDF